MKKKTIEASTGWVEISRNEADYCIYSCGEVTNNFELRQLVNDGSSTYDWFAVKQIFAMEPGCQAYGSEWLNDRGYPIHDYSVSSLNPQLHDWDPLKPYWTADNNSIHNWWRKRCICYLELELYTARRDNTRSQ